MGIKTFFKILEKLYSPDFDKKGKWITGFGVKYYCQATTFSFEIYRQEEAYTGKPFFKSDIYNFWMDKETRLEIMKEIDEIAERHK